jgi:hypothetical protein
LSSSRLSFFLKGCDGCLLLLSYFGAQKKRLQPFKEKEKDNDE